MERIISTFEKALITKSTKGEVVFVPSDNRILNESKSIKNEKTLPK